MIVPEMICLAMIGLERDQTGLAYRAVRLVQACPVVPHRQRTHCATVLSTADVRGTGMAALPALAVPDAITIEIQRSQVLQDFRVQSRQMPTRFRTTSKRFATCRGAKPSVDAPRHLDRGRYRSDHSPAVRRIFANAVLNPAAAVIRLVPLSHAAV